MTASRVLPPGSTLPSLETSEAVGAAASKPRAGSASRSQKRRSQGQRKRFATVNSFVDCRMRDLPRAAVAVWVALWRDERDGDSRTAMSDLARRVGCDKRTICRAIKRLRRDGLLEVVRKGGLSAGPNVYKVMAG